MTSPHAPPRIARARCTGQDFLRSLEDGGDACDNAPLVNIRVWLGAAVADLVLCPEHHASVTSYCRHKQLTFVVEHLP